MIFKSQKPQSVMVFAAVTTDGHKSPIIFVEANTKINSDIYIEILKDKIYPWVLSIYGKGPFVFQQDGALESKACAKPHRNVVQLKQSLKKAWASIPPETIVSACSVFQRRLREVVKNKGSHIE